VVVVDDGSPDASAEVAASFGERVSCLRQPNSGMAAARNRGAREAATEWLAFLDQDDLWLPAKLERQRDAAMSSGAPAVLTGVQFVDGSLRPLEVSRPSVRTDLEALLFRHPDMPQATPSTILVRHDLFDAIGGFDERLGMSADWDLLLRLRLHTDFAYVPEPLVLYRRHGANESRNLAALERESIQVLEKAFASLALPKALRRRRRRCLAWNDAVLSGSYWGVGRRAHAVALGLRALFRDIRLVKRAAAFPVRRFQRLAKGAAL
jgi:glycosyltransferase involved in cell wall biosynthesis